jgi:ribonuclease HI
MYFDGSFILNGAGGGVVLISPRGDRLLFVIPLLFISPNNMVEYEALINGLCFATELGVQHLYIRGDSELIVNQVMGELIYRDSYMAAYRHEFRNLQEKFHCFKLHHILWPDNEAVDTLTRLGSSSEPPPPGIFT